MIIGTSTVGKCVYDLPEEIKTLEEMRALIYGTHYSQRPGGTAMAAEAPGA